MESQKQTIKVPRWDNVSIKLVKTARYINEVLDLSASATLANKKMVSNSRSANPTHRKGGTATAKPCKYEAVPFCVS